jgi:hypothetical protein
MAGYNHPDYALSLAQYGTPLELPRCGGWLLERQIPGFPYRDAMGCYPLFCCEDWSRLEEDLDEIGSDLVSLSLVTDPFGAYDLPYLHHCFKDLVLPFKKHFIVDLRRPINEIVSKNRRKKVRRSNKEISIEICQRPIEHLDVWMELYSRLTKKHNITGMRAFSREAFTKQLCIPGMVMFRALHKGMTVGATLWYLQGEVGYGHLAAFDQIGYELQSSYALDWFSLEYFSDKVRWLDFGGSAGLKQNTGDGLDMYKKGWSSETRISYFCGKILNEELYKGIVREQKIATTDYFPAYRSGEFK